MSIKTFKPTTPSRRHMTVSGFDGIDKHAKPESSLTEVLKKNAGRNSYGRITVRHRGGGEKRKYRVIDFKRDKTDMPATVLRLEYDPNRSANIALVQYEDGEKRYIIAPVGLTAGDKVVSSAAADIKPGNCLPIANIPVGEMIHCIELYPGKGAQLVRAAGDAAQLMAKENGMAQVRLPSGEVRYVREECKATIGQVGNTDWANIQIGKAGRKRHMGWRPTVRGSVMNPCDHPHGGGEGKSPVGRPGPVTPWGKPAMGYKTRKLQNARLRLLDDVLRKYRKHGATIINCPCVKDVKRTTKWLRSRDYPVKAYYGKMKRCKRAHVQDYFLTEKKPIIVATNAFGLGIDRPDVRLVVHAGLPIGRAGRDGKKARAVLLYAPSDEYVVKNLIHSSRDPETVSRGKKRLKALKKVLREPNKVWKGITKYFR